MRRRNLACLALLAGITIAWILLRDRERDRATTVTLAPAPRTETESRAELAVPEPLREPVGRSEASGAEPDLHVLPVRLQARAKPAPDLDAPVNTLIAAGRVIDAAGRPVAKARIVAHTFPRSRDERARGIASAYYEAAETAEDGVFALYGSTNAARIDVILHHEHLLALPLDLPVGSKGIEIVARSSGGVTGQVLVEPEVPLGNLRMILRPENLPAESRMELFDSSRLSQKEVGHDCRFQLQGLLPWTYTFSVAAGSDVLAEIPGIEIIAGEITRDPRLEPLDLRGRLHVFTLDLVPPPPSFELSGSVLFTESGAGEPVRLQFFYKSPVVVVTPLAAIDVVVRAFDCRIEHLPALAERTELQLRAGLPVRLVLPRDVALPDPPLFVGARLVRKDEREGERSELWARSYGLVMPTPPFDENGEISCLVAEPGRHAVQWFVEHHRQGGSSSVDLKLPFDQVVVVEDREGEQRFEVVVTSGALAAGLRSR